MTNTDNTGGGWVGCVRRWGRTLGLGCAVLGVLLGCGQVVHAQSSSFSLGWDQPITGTQTLADVQAFTYTLKVNGNPSPIVASCTQGQTMPACVSPLVGVKSGDVLILTVANAIASVSADPLTVGYGASKPINVTVVVKITVP